MTQLKKLTIWGPLPCTAFHPFLELPLLESLSLEMGYQEEVVRTTFTPTSENLTSLYIMGGEPDLVSLGHAFNCSWRSNMVDLGTMHELSRIKCPSTTRSRCHP